MRSAGISAGGAVLALALCLSLAACGGDDLGAAKEPDPPVGSPVLPDLMPKPQNNVLTQKVKDRWRIRFNTIIVNVGEGDFLLRALRDVRGGWDTEQDIPYTEEGAKRVRIRAPIVWGGDGHEHWHIERVALVRLVPLDANGRVEQSAKPLVDTKVGFCFYDHTHELPSGLAERTYSAKSCGKEDTTVVGMGLSPGWNDTYRMGLPGQAIDVTGLPDGRYRLYTDVDPSGWFHEASTKNNRTWIDLDLEWTPQGLAAPTVGKGPTPS
jgi:Lysyl oxidase